MLINLEKFYLITFHLFTGLYLAGGFLISMAQFLKVKWTRPLKEWAPMWNKLSLLWPLSFIPLLLVKTHFFPVEEMGTHKETYLMTCFMLMRAGLYSLGSIWANRQLNKKPALSLILFFVIATFVSIDWGMSLEAHWASNIYGLMYFMNFIFGFFALLILTRFQEMEVPERKDLSHILIAAAIAWGYLQYSQYIILWMGNKPKEVWFYLERSREILSPIVIIILLKIIPVFGVSFFPSLKSKTTVMKTIALLVVLGTWLELIWLLAPPMELSYLWATLGSGMLISLFTFLLFSQRRWLV